MSKISICLTQVGYRLVNNVCRSLCEYSAQLKQEEIICELNFHCALLKPFDQISGTHRRMSCQLTQHAAATVL